MSEYVFAIITRNNKLRHDVRNNVITSSSQVGNPVFVVTTVNLVFKSQVRWLGLVVTRWSRST